MKFNASYACVRAIQPSSWLVATVFLQQVAAAGPLDDLARSSGGTEVQVEIATAIQTICPQLVSSFNGISNALAAPASPNKDITLRCNELIATSVDLAPGTPVQARSLNYASPDELLASLQQVTGEEAASSGTLTARASNGQFSNIGARLGALRMAATGAGSTSPATAFNLDFSRPPLGGGASADQATDQEEQIEGGGIDRAGFFINGNFNTGDRDASDLEDGFDFDVLSMTTGFDHRFNEGVLGVSVGYDSFESEFQPSAVVSGGEVNADGESISLFGLKEFGNFFIDGVVTFGDLSYDVERILRYSSENNDPSCQCPDQDRRLTANTNASHYGVSFTVGGQIFAGAWLIQPSFVASSRRYEIDGYTEHDTLPNGGMELRFGDQDIDSTESMIAVQFSRAINRSFGVLRPYLNLEWYHEFEDDQTIQQAKYAQEDVLAVTNASLGFSASIENCLSCFQISSEPPDTDYGVAGAGLSFVFSNFRQLLFYYEGLVGYDDLTSHAVTVNFRRQF